MQDRKISLRHFLALSFGLVFLGSILGGTFVLGTDWGAYNNLMKSASEAAKRGESMVIFSLVDENEFPIIMNHIAYANMIDLKLKEIQDQEACEQQHYIEELPQDPLLEVKL